MKVVYQMGTLRGGMQVGKDEGLLREPSPPGGGAQRDFLGDPS